MLDSHHLGDDLSGLFNHHTIVTSHIQTLKFVEVVQAGPFHRRAGQLHRSQIGDRCQDAALADLHIDGFDDGLSLFSGKLVGDAPAWRPARRAELVPQGQLVDLDHHAIDLIVQLAPSRVPGIAEGNGLLDGRRSLNMRIDRHAQGPQTGQRVPMRMPQGSGERPRGIGKKGQVAGSGHPGIEELQRPCGRRAGIGQQGLIGLLPESIEFIEGGVGHVNLATDLQFLGHLLPGQERQGHGPNRADVGGHVVAGLPVPARDGQRQVAPSIAKTDGQAVYLEFNDIVIV